MTAPAPVRARETERTAVATGTCRRTLFLAFRSSTAAALVTYGFNLALVPLVLGRMGPELYGAWATVASILAVGSLADAGVRTEIIRRVGAASGAGDQEDVVRSVRQGVTLLAVLAALVTVVGAAAAPAIRGFSFPAGVPGYGADELDRLVRATVAVLAASLVANGYSGVLRGVQRGDIDTVGRIVAILVAAAVTVTGVALSWGLWALFLGSLTQLVVVVTWNWLGTRRVVPGLRLRRVPLTAPVVKGYLALSGLALLSQVSDVVDSQWDKVILSHFVGSSAVASFHIGTSLVLQAKALALLPLAPLLAAVAELRERDPARMEALFDLLAKAAMVSGAVVLGMVFVFVPAFVDLWLGPGQARTGTAVAARLFAVAAVLNLVSAPLAFRAFGEGWHALAAASSAVNMVVNAALSLVLTMTIGFNGALYGSIAGNLVGSVFLFGLVRRRMGERWAFPPLRALTVGALVAAAGSVGGLGNVRSWPSLGAAGAVYLAVAGAACARAERLPVRRLLSRPVTG